MDLTPKQLDKQSKVKIDRWIEVGSEEWRMMDDNTDFTNKCIRLGFQKPPFLFTDSMGRIWGKGSQEGYYPFHFEYGKQLIGYRMSKKAAN
jgi:hypothetical protein